jgi:hypothetical protein
MDGGLVIVFIVVIGFVVLILPHPRRVHGGHSDGGSGVILPDGKIMHKGKMISFAEAKRRGLRLDFAADKRPDGGYKPKAWR